MEFGLLIDHPEHLPTIARWYYQAWGHEVAGMTVEKTTERILSELHRDRVPVHLIAHEDGGIAGVAQLKSYEMDLYPEREFWLGGVYVDPAFRGRQLASRLVRLAEQKAREFGIDMLTLQTEHLDGGLYGTLGWQPVERVFYHGHHVLVMELFLQ